jgi:hypothetical protein
MVEQFSSLFPCANKILRTNAGPAAMSLNLEAIHPLYAPPEFASLYMRVLAENMTNEDWFDTSLEQRMWISRYLAFSHLCKQKKYSPASVNEC